MPKNEPQHSRHDISFCGIKINFISFIVDYLHRCIEVPVYFPVDLVLPLGWFKNPVSSETSKIMAVTTFSHYLGQNYNKNTKKLKIEAFLGCGTRVQSFST